MRASGHVVNELVPTGVNRLECESDGAVRSKRLPTRIRGRDRSDRIGVNSLSIQLISSMHLRAAAYRS